ncbi:hypothetical protein PHPALM_28333 [Phytophthora palmivora]|uniref:PiggyBac transposable element-derived protein domain-containing protein n=1 Tax=Phytophthora palmivora TaxID=4796 RepID=A0A2P4XAF3_9STRA|nr:hypothetical protein PHPALM_28333 [Phytophthora palmivora]
MLAHNLLLTFMLDECWIFMYYTDRRVGRDRQNFPARGLVRDYQRWMGSVGIHDQLRMQRYSIQVAYKPKKYYRSFFCGLVDMVLVNAFIVQRYHMKATGQKPPEHFKFLRTLHGQLLAVDKDKFEEIEARREQQIGQLVRHEHRSTSKPTSDGKPGRKRRARTCKVCAVYQVNPHKYTKYFCPGCSQGELREGRGKTCFQIWYTEWKNGAAIPPRLSEQHQVQDRRPGPQRKRRCRRVDIGDGNNSAHKDGNDSVHVNDNDSAESVGHGVDFTEDVCSDSSCYVTKNRMNLLLLRLA